MGKLISSKFIRSIRTTIEKNAPEILIGMGIIGGLTTTVLAVKATPKALRLIEEKKEELNVEKLAPIDVVKTTWKCYIPTAISSVASATCIICANSVHTRRNAVLATAYKLSESAFMEYKDSVVEALGEKQENKVQEKVSEKQLATNPVTMSEVIVTGYGDTLCFDPMSGRYFYSDIDRIKKAENTLNKRMLHDMFGYASLNDFYDELNLERTDVGDIIGWNTDNIIDMDIDSKVASNGKPSIVLVYCSRPNYDYTK